MLRKFKILSWLFNYKLAWLPTDFVGGLTTAAVVIPKSMAYSVIAGLPVEVGLYAALASMLAYPLFGSSRPLSVSLTSEIAILTGAAVIGITASSSNIPAETIATTLALLVGGFLLLARFLRLGFLSNFVSAPVLVGFKTGIGIVVIVSQLKSVFGLHIGGHSTIDTLLELFGLITHTHMPTLVVAISGLVILASISRFFPKLPAPMIWMVLSILASALFGFAALGISTVGSVPSGLPSLALPNMSLIPQLWPAALGIALMAFTESVAAARTFLHRDDPAINPNRELIALGAANIASAFVGGLPVGGGTSQTSVAEEAGVNSQMAQWVNALLVVVVLLLFSDEIGFLPQAALAILVIYTTLHMVDPSSFRAIAKIRRDEFFWALITLVGVIVIGTLDGILLAVAISILTLFYQSNHPPVYAVAYNHKKDIFRRVGEDENDEEIPGILILRTEGRLTFANAESTRQKMHIMIEKSKPKVVVLECSAIPDIEYTALLMLIESEENLRSQGISLWLAAVNPDLLNVLKRSSLFNTLGHDRMFFNLKKVLDAWKNKQND